MVYCRIVIYKKISEPLLGERQGKFGMRRFKVTDQTLALVQDVEKALKRKKKVCAVNGFGKVL